MGEWNLMKHLSVEKQHKEMPHRKKIIIAVIFGLAVCLGVLVTLVLTRERLAYNEAHDMTVEIAGTKAAVEGFLDSKPEDLDFDEKEQAQIRDFEEALDKCANYLESFSALNVTKDEKIAELYNKAKDESSKLEKLKAIWGDVKLLLEITDENLEKLKSSSSEKLASLATKLSDYRAKVAEFHEKYKTNAKKSDVAIEEYGQLMVEGDELTSEFEKVELADVLGMSRDDILGFYATIEELNNKLSEKL